jgi:hypothetical protein
MHLYCATHVQGIEVMQVDPTPPLVKLEGGSSELVGQRRCKIVSVLDCMRHFRVGDVSPIVWQDVWTVHISERQDKLSSGCAITYRGWRGC